MTKALHRELKKSSVQNDEEEKNHYKKLRNSLGIVIAAFAFILYSQSISFTYTLDDSASLKDNKITTQGFKGIPTLLATDYWYGFSDLVRGPSYRPASLVLFAIEWQFFPDNPYVNHLVNVLLYALTCWILFILLCQLYSGTTGTAENNLQSRQNLILPFVCCLLYVSHPIHTEVVNSIKSLDEILCFLFSLLSILLIIQCLKTKSMLKLVFGLILYFAALLSKETGITFLAVIPLTVFVFTNSKPKQTAFITLSLALVTATYLMIRSQVTKSLPPESLNISLINNTLVSAPDFITREATAIYVLLRYIFLLIIPHPLTYDYSFAQIKIHSITDVASLIGLIIYLSLLVYAIINIRKRSIVAFAILFYLVTLSVISNVFILIGATMAERFLYIPSLGYCIILALLLSKLTKTERPGGKPGKSSNAKVTPTGFKQFVSGNSILLGFVFAITAVFSIRTVARSKDWKDNATLFGHDVNVSDQSAHAHFNWAVTLFKQLYPIEKNPYEKNILLDKSISEFKKAIAIYDNTHQYYVNLGLAYSKKQDAKNAIENYEKAIKLMPKPDGELYANLGHEYLNANQLDKAIAMEDSAIKYKPDFAFAYNNKGCALGAKGDYEESIPYFLKAIELDPGYPYTYKNLGISYFNIKEYSKAIENLTKTLLYDSNDIQAVYFTGLSYQMVGDLVSAGPYIEKYNRATNKQ